jgi:hypothetical protein
MFTAILFYYIVVYNIAMSYIKPIIKSVLVYLYKMFVLVALKALCNSIFFYKRLIVV